MKYTSISCLLTHLLVIITLLTRTTATHYFTSVHKTKELVFTESKMITVLGNYIDDMQRDGDELTDNIFTFYNKVVVENEKALASSGFIENPLNSLTFFKRMHTRWDHIITSIDCNDCVQTAAVKRFNNDMWIIQTENEVDLSTMDVDVQGALIGITRLRKTYKLDVRDLISLRVIPNIWPWMTSLLYENDVMYENIYAGKRFTTYKDRWHGGGANVIRNVVNCTGSGPPEVYEAIQISMDKINRPYSWILTEQSEPLTFEDVFAIQTILDENDEYAEAVRWLQGLYDVMRSEGSEKDSARVVRLLASALWKTNHNELAISLLKDRQNKDPSNERLNADIAFYSSRPMYSEDSDLSLTDETSSVEESLCMGKGIRNIKVISKLKCLYRKTVIPIYVAKEEVLSIDPRVSLVYDVSYESEQMSIKQLAFSRFSDSQVQLPDGSPKLDTKIRVSQTSWVFDMDLPLIQRVSKRVELITGLSTNRKVALPHAEPLQVLNYGFGGMYTPHTDYLNLTLFPDSRDKCGDRLATWIFYLNEVKAGGSTIFPKLNITVPVKRGAAAFWYNMKRNGERDERTLHSGCPVIIGSKWVANKWIRETGQIFRRKCGHSNNSIDGLVDSTSTNQF